MSCPSEGGDEDAPVSSGHTLLPSCLLDQHAHVYQQVVSNKASTLIDVDLHQALPHYRLLGDNAPYCGGLPNHVNIMVVNIKYSIPVTVPVPVPLHKPVPVPFHKPVPVPQGCHRSRYTDY